MICQLQQQALKRLRLRFPRASYEKLAAITKIQSTRLYRLFNGWPMKLGEYSKIKEAIGAEELDFAEGEFRQLLTLLSEEREYIPANTWKELQNMVKNRVEMARVLRQS